MLSSRRISSESLLILSAERRCYESITVCDGDDEREGEGYELAAATATATERRAGWGHEGQNTGRARLSELRPIRLGIMEGILNSARY